MPLGEIATASNGSVGVMASACLEEEIVETREAPTMRGRGSQLELREEQARSCGWRTGSYCVLGSAQIRRVKVPLAFG